MKFNHPILLVIKKSKLNYRYAFTLVELLVAMALIIFMLSIMSQAFVIATTAMSGLKKVTDLVDRVRPVLATLEKDLGSYHFEGSKRLSDPDFWSAGPPSQGYFMVWQDKPNSNHYPFANTPLSPLNNASTKPTYGEGVKDGMLYGISSADANHMLAFTTKVGTNLAQISADDYYGVSIPYQGDLTDIPLGNLMTTIPGNITFFGNDLANIYFPPNSNNIGGNRMLNFKNQSLSNKGIAGSARVEKLLTDWAEVAYFLRDTGRKTDNGIPICALYRQQRFLLPEADLVNSSTYYLNPKVSSPNQNLRPTDYIYNISHFTNNDDFVDINNYRTGASSRADLPTAGNFVYANPNWPIKFNTPETVTVPWRRLGNRPYNHAGALDSTNGKDLFVPYDKQLTKNPSHPGAFTDLFLDNVISFDVRLMVDNSLDYRSLWEIAGVDARNVQAEILSGANSFAPYPDRYPGPDSPADSNVTFTPAPYAAFGNVDKLFRGYGYTRSVNPLPHRLRTFPAASAPYGFYDRVVFDTWSTKGSYSIGDSWFTNFGGSPLELANSSIVYPKPSQINGGANHALRNFADGQPISYDPGVLLPSSSFVADTNFVYDGMTSIPFDHDLNPMTPDVTINGTLFHPFYGQITNSARLQEILDKHSSYSWMPSPGLGPDRIPLWQNSYIQAAKINPIPSISYVYFPKGPIIKAIQVSIRIYDESTKTAKEFKLIQRL